MAVGMLMVAPGFNENAYNQVSEKVFGTRDWSAGEAPDGLIVHSAGPSQDGWYVYDMWESREHFQRFAEERLMPAITEVLGGPPPEGAQPQFFEIAHLVKT